MISEPKFVTRAPQPFAAIRIDLDQREIATKTPPLIGEILDWVGRNGEQAGPAFFNYVRMQGMAMSIDVGVPTSALLPGDGRVRTGMLPGGRYGTVTFTGHYNEIRSAHEALHAWLGGQAVPPQPPGSDMTLIEFYETDPAVVTDPRQWVTRIEFKVPD